MTDRRKRPDRPRSRADLEGCGIVAALGIACACLLVLIAVSVARGANGGTAYDATPATCDRASAGDHLRGAKRAVRRAFHVKRILDATPARARERRAWRSHRRCLLERELKERVDAQVASARRRFDRRFSALLTPPGAALLAARRSCESGSSGSYAEGTDGGYGGAYQFDATAWALTAATFERETGLRADPSRLAAPREQDIRAAILDREQAGDPWPNCP